MHANLRKMLLAATMMCAAPSAFANVITDWDEKAVAVVTSMPAHTAQRVMAMVHAAMFDAVNSIERRYQPYLVQLPAAPTTSKEAAAAAAAATVLATIDPKTAHEMRAAIATYLVSIPDGAAKSDGVARESCRKGLGGAGERWLRCARCLSAEDHAGCLCADGDHGGLNLAEHEAVRHSQLIPISAKPADFAGEQGVGNRLH